MCQSVLASCYENGEGVPHDERMAMSWFLKAATEGDDSNVRFHVAEHYEDGLGIDAPNMKEAIKWYQISAAEGNADAQLALGNHYGAGNGVKENPGLAFKLWHRYAKHHDDDELECGDETEYKCSVAAAHYNIAECYCLGSDGVEEDMHAAMQWWTKAACLGSPFARSRVGEIYLVGFDEDVPVGTFDRDVALGVKNLLGVGALAVLAVAAEEDGNLTDEGVEVVSKVETSVRDFYSRKPCMGCGTSKARKLCSGCLDADLSRKFQRCGKACQLVHWRHKTASHKAECSSRVPGGSTQ